MPKKKTTRSEQREVEVVGDLKSFAGTGNCFSIWQGEGAELHAKREKG